MATPHGNNENLQTVSVKEFRDLQEQFKKLLQMHSGKATTTMRFIIEKDPPQSESTGLKPTKLPEFNGNRAEYPAWRAAVLDNFRMDWNLFGYDNSRAFLVIYNALKGTARIKAGPFYEAGGVHETRDPEDFIEFLDRLYLDSTRISRANTELHSMKMKEHQRWSDYFAAWSNKLTEARGDFWPDDNKISMLQNGLNKKLTMALAGNHMLPDDDFNEWIRIVNKVAQRLETTDDRFSGRRVYGNSEEFEKWNKGAESPRESYSSRETSHDDISESLAGRYDGKQHRDIDESGDTVMGGVNSARVAKEEQRRAKWKTKSQLEKLRQEGRCFRCERKGCVTKRCPLLPAIKPKNISFQVSSASLPEIDPSVYVVEENDAKSEN